MNKKNLLKLADFLEKLPQENFDMAYRRWDGKKEVHFYKSSDNCGTIGDVMGWAPFVEGLYPLDQEFFDDKLFWPKYESRVFHVDGRAWVWLFSSDWAEIDNTPQGAARRIRYLVKRPRKIEKLKVEQQEAFYISELYEENS